MNDAMKQQVGGSHYKGMKIEPFEFGHANGYDPEAFSIMKYVSRHRSKGGLEDLKKARHIVDIRVALFYRWGLPALATSTIPVATFIKENDIPEPDANTLRRLHFIACFNEVDSVLADAETLKSMIDKIVDTYQKETT